MNLTITDAAQTFLISKLSKAKTFLLTLNDGSNQFSTAEGCCMIGDRFQIVVVEDKLAPFTIPLESNAFTVYTSEYDKMFLGKQIILDFNQSSHLLVLKNENGILDINVALRVAEPTEK